MTNPSLKNPKKSVIPPNLNNTKLNVFYGRYSTSKQKNSLDTQMNLVSNYCSLNDMILDKILGSAHKNLQLRSANFGSMSANLGVDVGVFCEIISQKVNVLL